MGVCSKGGDKRLPVPPACLHSYAQRTSHPHLLFVIHPKSYQNYSTGFENITGEFFLSIEYRYNATLLRDNYPNGTACVGPLIFESDYILFSPDINSIDLTVIDDLLSFFTYDPLSFVGEYLPPENSRTGRSSTRSMPGGNRPYRKGKVTVPPNKWEGLYRSKLDQYIVGGNSDRLSHAPHHGWPLT